MIVWAALLLFQHQAILDLPATDKNPYTSEADIALGKKMYAGRCAGCHEPTGDGGKGTNLATPLLPRAQTDLALYRTIRYGLPDTEMPSHNMTQREIWQIAAYVRTLGQSPGELIAGNADRGAALLRGKGGCLQCHVLDGEGGLLGPSLTDIGTRRSPSYIRTKLIDPGQDSGDFGQVRLTTQNGRKLTGIRLNEDTWSIQLRDMSGSIHSYWKQDLADFAVQRKTLMPSYRHLSKQELDDMVAFLSGTGGRP